MKIIYGKKLFTLDEKMTTAEAIAFENGEIVKIGSKDELVSEFPEAELVEDYKDNYIYPSWVEPHSHIIFPAMLTGMLTYIDMIDWDLGDVVFKGSKTSEDFYARMAEEIEKNPDSERYMFYGWTPMVLGDIDYDKVRSLTDKPLLIVTSSTHQWNTFNGMDEYLGLAGQPDSHFIGKDDNGVPVSYAELAALPAIIKIGQILAENPEILQLGLKRVAYLSKKYGISTMTEHAQGLSDVEKEDFILNAFVENLYEGNIRLVSLPWLENWFKKYGTLEEVYKQTELRNEQFKKGEGNFFYDRWIKIHLDGAIKDEEIKLSVNFNGEEGSGEWNYSRMDTITSDIQYFWDRGYSISFHTQGDGAFDKYMEIYDEITKTTPKEGKIYRIEHLGFPPQRYFDWLEAKDENDKPEVSGYSLYTHLYYEGFNKTNKIPEEIRKNLNRFKSVLNSGAKLSLHTDVPNAPTNPLFTAWVAVTRETIFGNIVNESERLTREEALTAITREAANMTKLGHITGSLEVGKKADINILSKDLFECDIDDWKELPSIQTYFEGKEVK